MGQTVGAILGSAFMFAVLPDAIIDATHLGGCRIGPNIDQGGAFVAEFMFTFVLLFIAYGCALDARQGAVFGPVSAHAAARRRPRGCAPCDAQTPASGDPRLLR